jgi:hypothetical protein
VKRSFVVVAAALACACGSSSSPGDGGAGDGGGNDASAADGSVSDGGGGGDGGSGSCACNAAAEYCLHSDTTLGGAHDANACTPQAGGCSDCACYSNLSSICFEQAKPYACTVTNGVIVVSCSETQ